MPQLSWGNRFCRCELVTDCAVSYQIGQDVLGRWDELSSSRRFGPWEIEAGESGWRVRAPRELKEILSEFDLPDVYGQPEEAVKAVEFQAVAATIRLAGAPTGFHGALLRKNGVGLALVGIKEAGKSTLAAALSQDGWELFSDDAFQLEKATLLAHPVCRRSRLRAGSRALLSEGVWGNLASQSGSFLQPDGGLAYHSQHRCMEGIRLTHMILLKPGPGELRELEPSDFLLQTVVHCHTYYTEGLPQSLSRLAPISNKLRGFELGRNPLNKQLELLGSLR